MTDLPNGPRSHTTVRHSQEYGSRTLLEEVMEGRPLTPREIEILYLASQGDSAQESAERLHLSNETVKGYRKRIVAKLAAKNITHAVTIGFRRGLIHL